MNGLMHVIVFCPYEEHCPVKARQKSARTELCILNKHPEDCKLIRQGGRYESIHQRPDKRI